MRQPVRSGVEGVYLVPAQEVAPFINHVISVSSERRIQIGRDGCDGAAKKGTYW